MAFFPANFMLQPPNDQTHHHQQHFHHVQGVAPILGKRSMSFSGMEACQEEEDNLSDIDGSQHLAGDQKKRRLNMEQVKTLERNFEVGNKLDPDRKMQLARALGLQPRQVAIWFQNRRARWKTKQLERDFNLLKKQLDSLKSDNQSLLAYNQKLQAEVLALKGGGGGGEARESINLNKETDQGSSSNRSESSSGIKLDISTRTPTTTTTTTTIENESPFCAHQQPTISSRVFFPPSSSSSSMINNNNRSSFGQLFQNPQTSRIDLHSHRFDQPVKEETFNNMFCAVDQDHSGFWPWIDQQNFH